MGRMRVTKERSCGHEMTVANTTMVQGYPRCKACVRERKREHINRDRVPDSFDAALFDALHRQPEPAPRVCCARCARGTKQFAKNPPCGDRGCRCHGRV